MLFSKYFLLALPATTLALNIPVKRDYATVKSDLELINSDTIALNNAVTAFDGTSAKTSAVINAESKLESDIKKATSDCNASPVATDTQAQTLIDYVNNTLEPNTKSALAATKAKKAAFTQYGLKSTVQKNLATLRSLSSDLQKCLVSKAPSGKQSAATAAGNKILADFDDAISYYST